MDNLDVDIDCNKVSTVIRYLSILGIIFILISILLFIGAIIYNSSAKGHSDLESEKNKERYLTYITYAGILFSIIGFGIHSFNLSKINKLNVQCFR